MIGYSLLLSEILRQPWYIAPHIEESLKPLVINLLRVAKGGKSEIDVPEKGEMAVRLFQFRGGNVDLADIQYLKGISGFSMGASRLSQALAEEEIPEGSVAVIPVVGTFMKYGSMCAWGANEITPVIEQAARHKQVSAIVLRGDSGGGAVNAIPPFIQAIKVAKAAGKPVVYQGDLTASAAYYVATYCDKILADNVEWSCFGSIGTMNQVADYSVAMEKEGVKLHTIYPPESNFKNKEYHEVIDNGNYEPMIKNLLSPLAQRFQNAVKENRPNLDLKVEGILNGRMFFAEEAKQVGLIDDIGNLQNAVSLAGALAEARKFMSNN